MNREVPWLDADRYQIQQVEFKRQRLNITKVISKTMMERMVHRETPMLESESVAHEFTTFVYTRDINPFNVDVPATWFQHLKLDLFPAWLLKKFPVRYKKAYVPVQELLVNSGYSMYSPYTITIPTIVGKAY